MLLSALSVLRITVIAARSSEGREECVMRQEEDSTTSPSVAKLH